MARGTDWIGPVLFHDLAKRAGECRALIEVGRDLWQLAEREPLTGKVLHEGDRLGVLQHPLYLSLQILPQLTIERQAEQLIVRHRAPEKIRQPAGQLQLADLISFARLGARR